MEGTIKFYNADKGFGFVVPQDGTPDTFFHISQCVEGWEPMEGEFVTYEIGSGRDGRPAATDVAPTGEMAEQEEYQEEEEEQAQE